MIADLHNHNHSRAYLWLKAKERKFRKKEMFNPWTVVASNMKARKKGGMASAYGQADLVKLMNGNVRLTFNALYPIEKGFFDSDAFKGKGTLIQRLIRFLSDKKLPLRDLLQMFVMRIPDRMIDYFQSDVYKYWNALLEEYEFAISRERKWSKNRILIPGARNIFESAKRRRARFPELLDGEGTYTIPKSKDEIRSSLNKDANITMILTIEGAHSFGIDSGGIDDWLARVDHVKNKWIYPVFFVTFAHHFDNKLCGHAHSFPDISNLLLDQSVRMNEGFNQDGWKLIRKLLAISDNNQENPSDGYRVLIDVKHMSAKARQEYYEQIIKPCHDNGIKIPVIASHNGHSGRDSLDELIVHQEDEEDDSFAPTGILNNWNINVCNEDVRIIYETNGLLGLSLDQRIMGVPKKQKKTGGRNTVMAIWNSIEASVSVIYDSNNYPDNEKIKIWNCITLGSDFEGFIDPINEFKTALEYEDLREQLVEYIDLVRESGTGVLFGLTSREDVKWAIDQIFFDNAERFVIENYPK